MTRIYLFKSYREIIKAKKEKYRPSLRRANLIEAKLSGINLRLANLSEANLRGADLRWANLGEAKLNGANLSEAKLRWTNLNEAILIEADLRRADLGGAKLNRADLRWADLSEANLNGADLSGADLSEANLRWANLKMANLDNTNLSGANLSEANLSEAKNLLNASKWMSNNFKKDDLGYIVYKRIGKTEYFMPSYWEIKPSKYISEIVNPDRGTVCGSGVSFGTKDWCEKHYMAADLWKCRLRWEDLPGLIVPFHTDGKARCERLELIKIVRRVLT